MVADHKLTVPLHFINEEVAVGVKQAGGEISHTISEVEVSCLPKDLPEFIEVDMAKVELGQIVHLSDLKAPKASSWYNCPRHDCRCQHPRFPRGEGSSEEGAAE